MSFTWINKKTVRSSEGFLLKFTGRFTGEYHEGKSLIRFEMDCGVLGTKTCISIKNSAFSRWSDNSHPIAIDDQLRIIKNVRDACDFQGLAVVLY